MSATSNPGELRLPVESLRLGLFVSALDRPWSETPFLFQGFRIETEQELHALRKLCRSVSIDPVHSDPAALRELAVAGDRREAAARASDQPAPRSAAPRGEPIPWLRRPPRARTAVRSRRLEIPPVEPLPERERSALVPASVALVRYRQEVPFETEIDAAGEAAALADDALKALLADMAAGGELKLVDVRATARDLAASVVRNPDALQWLVRLRDNHADVYAHGVKVAVYLLSFARHLGFAPAELVQMATIGLLLDVGKIYIEPELLARAGALTPAERSRVQEHVRLGLQALAGTGTLPATVLQAIAEHHERVDGTGYPSQLAGDAISIHGRMAAIADAFSAMTSPRPYAPTLAPFDAIRVLYAEAGRKFHAPLVEQFVQAVGIFPTGALVELSTGEVAVVVCHNRVRRLEPRVLVVTDRAKRKLEAPYELDLLTQSPASVNGKPIRIDRGLPEGAYGLDLASLYAG
jgi:HD-GYP domain-containing protein (c-di-GMP phosphodiesterase class II)